MLHEAGDEVRKRALSELVNPVVLDSEGQLWPLCYQMPGEPRIAGGGMAEWERGVKAYKAGGAERLRHRLERAFEDLEDRGTTFVDWPTHVAERRFAAPRAPRAVELELLRGAV